MDENLSRLQSIARNSNLVATAAEFLPNNQCEIEKNKSQYGGNPFSCVGNVQTSKCEENRINSDDGSSKKLDSISNRNYSGENSSTGECSREANKKSTNRYCFKKRDVYFQNNREGYVFKRDYNGGWRRNLDVDGNQNRINRGYSSRETNRSMENAEFERGNKREKAVRGSSSANRTGTKRYEVSDSNECHRKNYYPSTSGGSNSYQRQRHRYEKLNPNYSGPSKDQHKLNVRTELEEDGKENSEARKSNFFRSKPEFKSRKENELQKSLLVTESFYVKNLNKEHDEEDKFNEGIAGSAGQRDQLIRQLSSGTLECLVCCEVISQNHSTWSCCNCYHVFHLKCIIKWARSSKSDFGWRCPACQNNSNAVPLDYNCFCGKVRDPEWNHQDCPHSCGEVCGKTFRKWCVHKCTLLCHPGPCPQCTATVSKSCGCQKMSKTVQCCSSEVILCDEVCGKELNCLIHLCSKKCHTGKCEDCKELVDQGRSLM